MTWPAVPPYAALRIPRTVAGRRVLQVALLVGGLFVLGFLCGGRASAAEGTPTATTATTAITTITSAHTAPVDDVRALADGAVERLVKPPAEPEVPGTAPEASGKDRAAVGDVEDQVLRPVTEHVVGVVDGKVLQPVGDVVETVTEQLGQAQAELPALPSWPGLPEMPEFPEFPGLPAQPGLPELPELPELPVQTPPVATTPQPESPAAGSSDRDGSGDGSARRSGRAAETLLHDPPSVAGSPTTGTAAQTDGQRAGQAARLPVQQAPAGDSGGAPGNRPTADNGPSRHGDAHAVSLNHRAPVRLVAGATARADAAVTRDRHRDIPVSPA